MELWIAGVVGVLVGAVAAGVGSRVVIRRSIARARAAERRARASQHLAEVGAMTGGLAHEIRNPLSTLGMNAQLLGEAIEDLPVPEQDRARLTRRADALRRETERLRGILQDFLEFAGELRVELRDADLRAIVEELGDFFTPQAEARGVRVRITVPPEPLPGRIDAGHLKQALLNLMLNAVDAMEAQGAGEGAGPRELIIRAEPGDAGGSRVHVTDTGPGIDAEARARIFHPYFTTKSGGTGLGLPTSRRIVEAHGGHIEVHSEPGRGTDFVISLPAPAAEAPTPA